MYKYFVYGVVALFLLSVNSVAAAEIQYGNVEKVRGTEIHIHYKGPGGEQHFVCDVLTSDCKNFGTIMPTLFPEIDGKTSYPSSPDGRYGIIEEATNDGFVYKLYDVSGNRAAEIATLPYTKATNAFRFSSGNDHLMLFGADGTVATYTIDTKAIFEITPSQREFPQRSLSPHARYLAAYNYSNKAHKIWNAKTGNEISIPSASPAFVEFSQSERYASFADDREGYRTIYIADLATTTIQPERIFKDNFTVEDYLWFKDKLYAVGNTQADPYRWVLYQYDPTTKHTTIVAENVSYGDYIRAVGEHALSFLVIEGKNRHVALYRPDTEQVAVIRPVSDSPASTKITRSVVAFNDGVKGILYAPQRPKRSADLFVWLHGGPKRQTSFGYHSYLSYAVYDELLEKLVESGAYVLKLDYGGSYGHGSAFMNQLTHNLGKIDVEHVVDASREIQRKYRIDNTYLIGNSYGGYLGPKALVDHERYFDGAIAINGVFDWSTLIARIPSSPFTAYFNGSTLENAASAFDRYQQASIIKNLPDLSKRKKLLLIYGENDATVPTWQTREFFHQAEALDKNVELLKLEGEDHIIRKRESLNTLCSFIANSLRLRGVACR